MTGAKEAGRQGIGQLQIYLAIHPPGTSYICGSKGALTLMASSASMEQWSLTGGRLSSFAISVFLTLPAWSSDMPLTCSVMNDDEAIADPQPAGRKVRRG